MDLELKGKRALVTGSTGGLGEAIAKALAKEGAEVVIHGRHEERADKVAEAIRAAGGKAEIALGDLSFDQGAEAVATASLKNGARDILVNND